MTTRNRVQAVSEIPTIAEAGVPGFESYTWFGLFGPKGLDPDIVNRVNSAVRIALEARASARRSGRTARNGRRW